MRPHTQQQQHHQQQYCGIDNNLPPQQQQPQHSHKNNHLNYQGLQQHQTANHLQQQQQQQQNYHQQQQQQHQLQQHLNHGPLPAAANPHHMWNTHGNPNCYPLNAASAGNSTQLANSNNGHINLQNCRPYPPRVYGHPSTHPAHHATNGFAHAPPPPNHVNERVPLTAPNYAKLPPLSVVNQQRINECAGIPLISTASAHLTPGQRQRISRKQSHSPPGRNWPNVLANNAATAQNYAAAAQYAAAHAQGAPLMLNKQQQKPEYWSPNSYALQQQQQQQYGNKSMQFSKPQDRTRTPLRYQNSAPAALNSSRSKENLEQHLKHVNKDTENSSSNNGDSSNSNETCLPRIIKPRKRRKKDRKPPNNMINAVYMKMDNKPNQDKINSGGGGSSSIKPYKSSEDLMKCLQKFTQINNFKEDPSTKRANEVSLMIENNSQEFPQTGGCTSGRMDINHGICFCAECDPLRSIWDYPLRRSISDSSSSSTSGTGSLSEDSKQNDSISPKTRAEIVGVIGSKRNKDHAQLNSNSTFSTQYENLENSADNQGLYNMNILSGINLANELFKHNNSTLDSFTNLTNPLSSLLPETAETLLTKSINEISKKLIETCSNESADLPLSSNNSTFSTTSCSSSSTSSSANSTCNDFSNDSGIESAHINAGDDLVFNFDHLHITATKLSLSQQQQQSQSLSTSSCGNISTSTSPTVKFASNFLTTQTTCTAKATPPATTTHPHHHQLHQNPTTPSKPIKTQAPTLEFLVDLNNNQLHATTTATTLTKDMNVIQNNQQHQQQQHQLQQFNDLLQNHQPPQQHQQQHQLQTPHRHDQQFFNNCFDLMWQQHERQLGNNTSNNNDQLISSSSNTASNNVAISSFLDAVGSVKTVFSTIS